MCLPRYNHEFKLTNIIGCNKRFTQSSNLTAHEKTHSVNLREAGMSMGGGSSDAHALMKYIQIYQPIILVGEVYLG
jgi:hypothetical protein